MWRFALNFLSALLSGDFKRLWQEHKEKEADNAENKVASMSDSAVDNSLQHWKRPD